MRINNKKLKAYYCYISWYVKHSKDKICYNTTFHIWAYDKTNAEKLIKSNYGSGIAHLVSMEVLYRPVYTIYCRLFNKIPNSPKCKRI